MCSDDELAGDRDKESKTIDRKGCTFQPQFKTLDACYCFIFVVFSEKHMTKAEHFNWKPSDAKYWIEKSSKETMANGNKNHSL